MILFNCDYNEGAHPRIMQLLQSSNLEQTIGYGEDPYCAKAREYILNACGKPDADVHFLVGGTQCNLTVIAAALRPHQGVLAPQAGHINVHEAGAIEATGHKVLALPCKEDGKLTAPQVEAACLAHYADPTHTHMVQPKMVYISNATENGGVYQKAELTALRAVCDKYGLYLFLDGARLAYALGSPKNDLSLADLCNLCHAFYIGGTKAGTLFGEALVLTHKALRQDFTYIIKQRGGLLAKGRLMGIQFLCLFEHDLYLRIGQEAVAKALGIASALTSMGIPFLTPPQSNQIFPILANTLIEKLNQQFQTAYWNAVDETHSALRICTSWATTQADCNALVAYIHKLLEK